MGLLSTVKDVAGIGSAVADIGRGIIGDVNAQNNFSAQQAMQKQFAQNGIQWRVADAKAAGIHPLYALGAQLPTYSPSFAATSGQGSFGELADRLGQSVDRAQNAASTQEDRAFQVQTRSNELERQRLTNDQLRNDIALQQAQLSKQVVATQQLGPSMPSFATRNLVPGQGDSGTTPATSRTGHPGLYSVSPAQTTANSPGHYGTEAAPVLDLGFSRTSDGGFAPVPSKDVKERIEDDWFNEAGWKVRNLMPAFWDYQRVAPPNSWLPKGAHGWKFSVLRGAWYPDYSGSNYGSKTRASHASTLRSRVDD